MITSIRVLLVYLHRKTPTNFTQDGIEHQILYIDITLLSHPFVGDATPRRLFAPYMVELSSNTIILANSTWDDHLYHDLYPLIYAITIHHSSIPQYAYKKSLVLHLVNAAKQCIPVLWRSSDSPTVAMWFKRIDKVSELESLIHQANDNPSKYGKIWACWTHFRASPKYQELLHNS